MEELFRFNLVRAVQRSEPSGLSLTRDTEFQLKARRLAAAPDDSRPATEIHRRGGETIDSSDVADESGRAANGGRTRKLWGMLTQLSLEHLTANAEAWLTAFGLKSDQGAARLGDDVRTLRDLVRELRALGPVPPAQNWQRTVAAAKAALGSAQRDNLMDGLADLFVALLVVRAAGPAAIDRAVSRTGLSPAVAEFLHDRPSLEEVADLLRILDLLSRPDAELAALTVADVQAALQTTLLLPSDIFLPLEKPVHAVGVLDLLVVKQHILKYEGAEISRVENVLAGESRGHARKHTLSNQSETYWESEETTETNEELTTSDHVEMRQETEKTLKEDTKLDAGVHVQYEGGSFKLQSDLTTSYDRASSESKKSAAEIAKDITQKAAKKITTRVTQRQIAKMAETFEDSEDQSFNNGQGSHVIGVYQWLQKVYLAQVFNYGKHLIFDVMVPEPAASLRKQIGKLKENIDNEAPKPPLPFDISPTGISPDPTSGEKFYGNLVQRYKVTGVEPPPPASITVTSSKVISYEDDTYKYGNETLRIDDGYAAVSAQTVAEWIANDTGGEAGGVGEAIVDSYIDLLVGDAQMHFSWKTASSKNKSTRRAMQAITKNLNPAHPGQPVEEHTISYGFRTNLVNALTLNVEITCKRTDELLDKWRLQTYDKIVAKWQKLQDDYLAKLETLNQRKQDVLSLELNDEASNRQIERTELKRQCIALLDDSDYWVHGVQATHDWDTGVDPDLAVAEHAGTWVRWFEQAFEWDKIGYVFYPYFWADSEKENWLKLLGAKSDDALFLAFLRAGYARVTIPVREGFEAAVNFYMLTGIPWLGGGLPSMGVRGDNPLYLSIVEEMKESSSAPGDEKPVEEPWEIRLPTTLIKLRKEVDGTTPTWSRTIGASAAPDTAWTWTVDEPPRH